MLQGIQGLKLGNNKPEIVKIRTEIKNMKLEIAKSRSGKLNIELEIKIIQIEIGKNYQN